MRLVMPPLLAAIIAFPIWCACMLTFSSNYGNAFMSGALIGYICYDLTHYYLHHGRAYFNYFRKMKSYHFDHHYKNYDLGYGISSKLWDYVFGTVGY